MINSSERKQEIADIAEAVADEYCPEGIILPELIAKENHITYCYGHYGDSFDGMLEYNGSFHIYCNLDRVYTPGSPRGRFTFCHELGHYYIDVHRNTLISFRNPHPSTCEFSSDLGIEKEADLFASNLLIPRKRLQRFMGTIKRVKGLYAIEKIANHFKASITSAAITYTELNIFPCVIIKWDIAGKREWFSPSSSLRDLILGKAIESANNSGHESATNRAIRSIEGIYENGTTLSMWFSNISSRNLDRDRIYIEQAMRLGPFGYLTCLFPDE